MTQTTNEKGLPFQKEVFDLVAKKLRKQWPNATLILADNPRGIVDIVVDLERDDIMPTLGDTAQSVIERFYIECKNHDRRLGLDVTAKSYCAAIRYRPDYLVIVSAKGLQPQAVEYALSLFKCVEGINMVIGDAVNQSPLTNVKFFHYTLDELKGADKGKNSTRKPTSLECPNISLKNWKLISKGIFKEHIVASQEDQNNCVWVHPADEHILRLDISTNSTEVVTPTLQDDFGLCDGVKIKSIVGDGGGNFVVDLSIPYNFGSFARDAKSLFLKVSQEKGGEMLFSLRLPKVVSLEAAPVFENIRTDTQDELIGKMLASDGVKLAFLEGPGGIGKTYLAHGVCQGVQMQGRFIPLEYKVSGSESAAFFIQLLIPLLGLPQQTSTASKLEVLLAYLNSSNPEQFSQDSSLEEKILKMASGELSIEVLIALLSTALQTKKNNYILFIQNCQELSPKLAAGLAQLLQAFSSSSWARLRVILEFRSGESSKSWWEGWKSKLERNLSINCETIQLKDISHTELKKHIGALFQPTHAQRITDSLYAKAGGNPLFLDQAVRHFLSKGYIHYSDIDQRYKYKVIDPSGLRKELDHLPSKIESFLVSRLEHIIQNTPPSTRSFVEKLLLLLSQFPSGMDNTEKLLDSIIAVSERELVIATLISEKILRIDSQGVSPHFIHDFMKMAAGGVQFQTTLTLDVTKRIEPELDRGKSIDCLLGGRLHDITGNTQKALTWFDMGQERAILENNYPLRRMNLLGLDRVLGELPLKSTTSKNKYLDVKTDLGWTESQCGSLLDARTTYATVLSLAHNVYDPQAPEEYGLKKHYIAKTLHKLVTLDIEMLNIRNALESFNEAAAQAFDVSLLFHLGNRFILLASMLNMPDVSHTACRFVLNLAQRSQHFDAMSVVLSDVGSLYFDFATRQTTPLWQEGVKLAKEKRQKTHSQANMLSVDFVNKGCLDRDAYERLYTDVKAEGLYPQLTRLELNEALHWLQKQQYDLAATKCHAALNRALELNQKQYSWVALNNLACIYAVQGRTPESTNLALQLAEDAVFFLDDYPQMQKAAIQGLTILEQACNRLGVHEDAPLTSIHLPQEAPRQTGQAATIVHNLTQLLSHDAKVMLKVSQWKQPLVASPQAAISKTAQEKTLYLLIV